MVGGGTVSGHPDWLFWVSDRGVVLVVEVEVMVSGGGVSGGGGDGVDADGGGVWW